MLAVRSDTRHLIPLLLVLAFAAARVAPGDVYAEDSRQQDAELYGGKTLDEWIEQAKQGRRLEDREDALQVLRNHGLRHDRDKTLRAFTDLLSDKAHTVRSLAAVGLRKAGQPTDPMVAAKLVKIISQDLSGLKFPGKAGEVGGEFGGVMRALGTLEVIGETNHIPALQRVSENQKVDSIIRQAAAQAVRQIEKRASAEPPESAQASADDATNGNVAPGDKKVIENKTLVVTVFDEPLYLEDLTPAQAEVKRKELPQAEFDSPHDTTFTPEQRKGIMIAWQRASFQDWKVCKSLYEKYGGRVGFGSLGAWVAFDGQNALLRKYHQAGDIKFHDPEIEKAFWQHTQIKNFADAYPTGERLKRLLANPPHLSNQPATDGGGEREDRPAPAAGGQDLDRPNVNASRKQ